MKKVRKNLTFSSLGYVPEKPKSGRESRRKIKKIRKEAMVELEKERAIRRDLHRKSIELWSKYKKETKEKIQKLVFIVENGKSSS